jgi:uncharacterized protein YlxW (UPF0749 family)
VTVSRNYLTSFQDFPHFFFDTFCSWFLNKKIATKKGRTKSEKENKREKQTHRKREREREREKERKKERKKKEIQHFRVSFVCP